MKACTTPVSMATEPLARVALRSAGSDYRRSPASSPAKASSVGANTVMPAPRWSASNSPATPEASGIDATTMKARASVRTRVMLTAAAGGRDSDVARSNDEAGHGQHAQFWSLQNADGAVPGLAGPGVAGRLTCTSSPLSSQEAGRRICTSSPSSTGTALAVPRARGSRGMCSRACSRAATAGSCRQTRPRRSGRRCWRPTPRSTRPSGWTTPRAGNSMNSFNLVKVVFRGNFTGNRCTVSIFTGSFFFRVPSKLCFRG
jgi:hypothetical protein